jgi:hypothetical protein
MWARFQTAWQGATRASEPVPANALAIPRDVPIPTAFAACMAVATMAFLIGRLSGLPAASESHDATRPAATAPQPAVGSPYEREAFPTVAPPPEAPPSTAVTAPATAPSAADGPTRTPRVAATNSRSAPPAAAARNPDSRFRGSLAVGSAPLGAQVFVNGVLAGTTPLQLRNLPVGSRAVRIVKEGYKPWHGTVQIVSDRRTVTTASLIPLQP